MDIGIPSHITIRTHIWCTFKVWLGHLHLPSLSWRISKCDRITRTGVSVCPKVSASACTVAGKIATGWGRDQSRTPLTSKGARTFVQEMFSPWNRQCKRATNPQKKSNLNTAVRLRSWNRVVDNASKWKAVLPQSVCIPLTRGPDDALLFCSSILKRCYFISGGQTWWFCGQAVVPSKWPHPANQSREWRTSNQSCESECVKAAYSQGRLTLRENFESAAAKLFSHNSFPPFFKNIFLISIN